MLLDQFPDYDWGSIKDKISQAIPWQCGNDFCWTDLPHCDVGSLEEMTVALCFTNIKTTANGASSTLIDLQAYPDCPDRFAMIDNYSVSRSEFEPVDEDMGAICMSDGEDFDITHI